MAAIDEKRAAFQQYKEDVKEKGKPFYPFAMFHDTVMSVVVTAVTIGLTCVWYFTTSEDPDTCGAGDSCLLGPRYSEQADPGTTNFVPRPDWYFYFLFYLLRIFKWPESVILGTVGIPTVALVLLLTLPFLDLRRERRPLRRPVAMVAAILTVISMGVLTYKGATAREALVSEVVEAVPSWAEQQGFEEGTPAYDGALAFAESGCTACHTYLGTGGALLGAPDLSQAGAGGQTVDFYVQYISDPSQFGNTVMPQYESLGEETLTDIAEFLVASKGTG